MSQSTIRLAAPADAAAIQAIYAPFVRETIISFEYDPPSVAEIRQRMVKVQPQFPWLVSMRQGTVVGYAYASTHSERLAYQWSADVSVYLAPQWQGQGLGHALYTALFAILRAQGYMQVCAGISLPNPASVALHEKMGMLPVGVYPSIGFKMNAWHDVGWWQGSLQPVPLLPTPPLPLSVLMGTPAWAGLLPS